MERNNALIVEDLVQAQKVAENILQALGYVTTVVDCGAAALDLMIRRHFDLLLLDIELPDINGFEISDTIRGLEHRRNQPITIVALTAHVNQDLYYRCKQAGINHIIHKPLTIEKARYLLGHKVRAPQK
jgi:CheY-like chemotaxis protein